MATVTSAVLMAQSSSLSITGPLVSTINVTIQTTPPAADLFLSGLPTGTTTVRVWRVGTTQARVRGDDNAPVVAGAARMIDYDVPIGRPFAYRAEAFGADGGLLGEIAQTANSTLTDLDPNQMWLSDPLTPQLAMLVTLDRSTDQQRTYNSNITYATVIGRRRPNAISSQRGAAEEWSFGIKSYSFDESNSLDDLFAGGGVLLCRPHPSAMRHRTGTIYLSSPSITETPRRDYAYVAERADWVINGREVSAPGASAVAPARTWDNVVVDFTTWQDVKDNGGTWLDVLRG